MFKRVIANFVSLVALLLIVGCGDDKDAKSFDPVQSFKDDVVVKLNDPKIAQREFLYWLKGYDVVEWEIDVVVDNSLVAPFKATATCGELTFYFKFEDDQWSATGYTMVGVKANIGPNIMTETVVALNGFLGVE